MELELLEKINNLGIGPQGFGGRNFALGVHMIFITVTSPPCRSPSASAARLATRHLLPLKRRFLMSDPIPISLPSPRKPRGDSTPAT